MNNRTKNRINLTPSISMYDVLKHQAEKQGVSVSRLVTDILICSDEFKTYQAEFSGIDPVPWSFATPNE